MATPPQQSDGDLSCICLATSPCTPPRSETLSMGAMFEGQTSSRLHQVALATVLTSVLYYLYLSWNGQQLPFFGEASPPEQLHVLIPATYVNAKVCRCILSANILGYQQPVLINWNRESEFVRPKWRAGGTHIDKLVGVLRFLDNHIDEAGQSSVLVIDGFDTWFQLPPEVLLKRFHAINERNSLHIADVVGQDLVDKESLRQTIIYPAQKECGPKDSGDLSWDVPGCYAVPQSPLREDLYGPRTDIDDSPYPWRIRPRWLCSGLNLGPLEDLREMYIAGQRLIHSFNHGGSDQLIFSKLFGEQWYQRHVLKERLEQGYGAIGSGKIPATLPSESEQGAHRPMGRYKDKPLEFGMGLDYSMEISHSQVFSETDGRFIVYNDSESVAAQQVLGKMEVHMGYTIDTPRTTFPLVKEISSLPAPTPHYAKGAPNQPKLERQTWEEVPLYTNIYTGSIPVTIHMNGMKEMIEALWPKLWYYPRLRHFLEAEKSRRPVGAYDDNGNFLPWNELCGAYEDELLPPRQP